MRRCHTFKFPKLTKLQSHHKISFDDDGIGDNGVSDYDWFDRKLPTAAALEELENQLEDDEEEPDCFDSDDDKSDSEDDMGRPERDDMDTDESIEPEFLLFDRVQ